MPSPFDRVFLVRHGETQWNLERRRQGQLDSQLTPRGLRHAERVAVAVSTGPVDAIFSSPLERAYRTALILDGKAGCGVVVLDELAEVHHGALAGLTNDEIEVLHPGELLRRERRKYVWRFPGGESYADADGRACLALERVAQSGAVTPLLVTHEMIGRMLLRILLELSPDEAFKLSIPHGAVVDVVPRQRRLTITDVPSRGDL